MHKSSSLLLVLLFLALAACSPGTDESTTTTEVVTNTESAGTDDDRKILSGDLSDFAGYWENVEGERITLRADGTTGGDFIAGGILYQEEANGFKEQEDGCYLWFVHLVNSEDTVGSYAVSIYPVGVDVFAYGEPAQTDITKVRLYAGHDLPSASELADKIFYWKAAVTPAVFSEPGLDGFFVVDTLTIVPEKDKSSYKVNFLEKSETQSDDFRKHTYRYKMQILDSKLNTMKIIDLETLFNERKYDDVNLDGYTDMLLFSGGTINETYDVYTWQPISRTFEKVKFEGTENTPLTMNYTVHDGYIKNFWKDMTSYTIEKLIWRGNTLVKVSEETGSVGE